jgi:hypothetical protein
MIPLPYPFMYLSYYGITSKHVIFAMSFSGGQWQYTPPIVLGGGFSIRPEKIQAPRYIPAGEEIGEYTVPSPGIVLDYVEYEPFTNAPDGILDWFDISDWKELIANLLCREVLCYYLLPEEEPEEQGEYYDSWDDPYGYTHLIPAKFGNTANDTWAPIATNEFYEGMVIFLPYASIVCGLANVLPAGWHDAKYLCLAGGGIYPLIPRFCLPPDNFAGMTEFCISSLASWDGEWNHGYGNTSSEHCQLTSLEGTTESGGFPILIRKNEVVGWQFYGPTVYADEFIYAHIYYWSGWSPTPPRILPKEIDPPDNPGSPLPFLPILQKILQVTGVSIGVSRLWDFNINENDIEINSEPGKLKEK